MLGRELPGGADAGAQQRAAVPGPFSNHLPLDTVPLGGDLSYSARRRPHRRGAEPGGHHRHLRRLRGQHGVDRRGLAAAVPRHQHQLAGERSPARRLDDRLRRAHRGGADRRRRRVRRGDARGLQEPAHRGPLHGAGDARLRRDLGRRARRRGHRGQLRQRHRRGDHAGALADGRRRAVLARLPAQGRRRRDRRPHPHRPAPGARAAARLRPLRLSDRRPAVGRLPRLRPLHPAARLRPGDHRPRHRLRRGVRAGLGVAALRGCRRAPRRVGGDEGRRHHHRRGLRRLERHLFVQRRRPQAGGRDAERRRLRRPAVHRRRRLHRRRQRHLRVAALRRQGQRARPVHRRRGHRRGRRAGGDPR